MCSEYNGWTNYETWACNLELCDDIVQGWREDGVRFDTVGDLKEALKDTVEELFEQQRCVAGAEFLHSWAMRAIGAVDWWSIARAYEEEMVGVEGAASPT